MFGGKPLGQYIYSLVFNQDSSRLFCRFLEFFLLCSFLLQVLCPGNFSSLINSELLSFLCWTILLLPNWTVFTCSVVWKVTQVEIRGERGAYLKYFLSLRSNSPVLNAVQCLNTAAVFYNFTAAYKRRVWLTRIISSCWETELHISFK